MPPPPVPVPLTSHSSNSNLIMMPPPAALPLQPSNNNHHYYINLVQPYQYQNVAQQVYTKFNDISNLYNPNPHTPATSINTSHFENRANYGNKVKQI
jgi:hypothetical protein